ncbi:hypothetical protein [Rubellicoccus peritrichatus]|uniref:Spermidine synthase n=1 Tax=Rubellicoccus peritrichatus TaxID=3080537 RepID=A0AAQ3L6Z9_9BACT|nr:hypothetical protein [Puniceicoccus sp. CR14]WOO40161.1 hypothetical protein RZN69_16185 [Puniceicoccus sp. CR14]
MDIVFEELDYCETHMGDLMLRKRSIPSLDGKIIYEVKLGEEFLMSSLFHDAEVALSHLGLDSFGTKQVDVVVGGLGLGYTAQAALEFPNLRSLTVIEGLSEVIGWHKRGLVPLGEKLTQDSRCRLLHGDFFELAQSANLDPEHAGRKFHAILLDIDHTPEHFLHLSHGGFYQPEGLEKMARHLHPGGVFALWSDDKPDEGFCKVLESVFASVEAHLVEFDNPILGGTSSNSVYVAYAQ